MENVSTDARDDGEFEAEREELALLLAELVRKGWQLTFHVIPNDWMAVSHAEVVFERVWDTEPPRTPTEDFQALAHGLAPQAPVHSGIDPFEPNSIYKAVKRFHHLFVGRTRTE